MFLIFIYNFLDNLQYLQRFIFNFQYIRNLIFMKRYLACKASVKKTEHKKRCLEKR